MVNLVGVKDKLVLWNRNILFVIICRSSTDGGEPLFSNGITVFRY